MSRTTCLALKRESHPINLEPTRTQLLVRAGGPNHTRPHPLARSLGSVGCPCGHVLGCDPGNRRGVAQNQAYPPVGPCGMRVLHFDEGSSLLTRSSEAG